ncbi:hypothetical protein KKB40_06415, partial [Patescibacteria group bacterium]|nr:hypothetical protein [Patescibacteria group bacterium]
PGHCPIDPYEFCVENIAVQDCPSGGGLLCFINYYSPIGTNEPFNQGACASRTEDALCSPIGSPACCPVCPVDYAWSYTNLTCIQVTATDTNYADPNFVDCSSSTLACYPGHGCIPASTAIATPPMKCDPAGQPAGTGIDTAIGCIPFADNNAFVKFVLGWSIGIGGGISFLLSAASGFIMATSAGDPKKLAAGKELLMAALSGLLLLIFSVFVLRLFGFEILQIPGF